MPPISKEKKEKISEQILSYLYHIYPQSKFTAEIAKETARDEEFMKTLLEGLEKKGLVKSITKNPKGVLYSRRIRWTLTPKAYDAYKGL